MECASCPVQPLVDAFVAADLDRNMGRCQSKRLKEACKKLQEAFQNVCLTCVDEVNDNNPSNHGQTFYSLDSGHCQSTSGRSATSHSDNNEVISRADWINSHASYDSSYYQDNSFRPYNGTSALDPAVAATRKAMRHATVSEQVVSDGNTVSYETRISYPDTAHDKFFDDENAGADNPFQDEFSITSLPSSVEAIILRELNNFAALPALHKMLVCCLLAGINISDFARMGWLPKEIKKMMKPKEKDDEEVISAQTAHAIYQNICKKLPYMTVLSRATKKRSKERIESQNLAIKMMQKVNRKRTEYLSSPDKMKELGKPKYSPHGLVGTAQKNAKTAAVAEAQEKPKKAKPMSAKKARQEYLAKKYQQEDMFAIA